jgi:eukaryotic-like serine/threonine-protein kinase
MRDSRMHACTPSVTAQSNSLFGPYRIGRRIGRGGMAETFAASRDLGTGASQDVCLKCMLPGLIEDAELAHAFLEEARLAAQLVHTNIAALIDHGTIGETHYLALELVDGIDLRGLLREANRRGERLPPEIVAEIAFAIAHALDYAHAIRRDSTLAGAIHRDISPSNVLLGLHGEVKLADFGIAKVAGASHHTRTGLL